MKYIQKANVFCFFKLIIAITYAVKMSFSINKNLEKFRRVGERNNKEVKNEPAYSIRK